VLAGQSTESSMFLNVVRITFLFVILVCTVTSKAVFRVSLSMEITTVPGF